MAKKAPKKTSKKRSGSASRTPASGASSKSKAGKKTSSKKTASKKTTAKKTTAKKTSKKPARAAASSRKTATKKTTAKKTTTKKKATTKKPTSKKPTAKKTSSKKAPAKKVSTKKTTPKKAPVKKASASKKPVTKKAASKKAPAKADAGKPNRKGITIVSKKRPRSERPKTSTQMMSSAGSTSLSSLRKRKPLIPSGPKAAGPAAELTKLDDSAKLKSPFNKRQLDKFRRILLDKKRELVGGVSDLESEALRGNSGSLSHVSQHMADQGSDAADQSLSLDLAAAERKLIKEIDEALERIENRTYGVCELTGEPISTERLEELPWARYSIAAARQLERHGPRD